MQPKGGRFREKEVEESCMHLSRSARQELREREQDLEANCMPCTVQALESRLREPGDARENRWILKASAVVSLMTSPNVKFGRSLSVPRGSGVAAHSMQGSPFSLTRPAEQLNLEARKMRCLRHLCS